MFGRRNLSHATYTYVPSSSQKGRFRVKVKFQNNVYHVSIQKGTCTIKDNDWYKRKLSIIRATDTNFLTNLLKNTIVRCWNMQATWKKMLCHFLLHYKPGNYLDEPTTTDIFQSFLIASLVFHLVGDVLSICSPATFILVSKGKIYSWSKYYNHRCIRRAV